jgi:hypothetical protein
MGFAQEIPLYLSSLVAQSPRQHIWRLWNRPLARLHRRPLSRALWNSHGKLTDIGAPLLDTFNHNDTQALLSVAESNSQRIAVVGSEYGAFSSLTGRVGFGSVWKDQETLHAQQRFRRFASALVIPGVLLSDVRAIRKALDSLDAWIAGRVHRRGIALDSFNTSLRIREWVFALLLLHANGWLCQERLSRIVRSLRSQAYRLSRHIEYETPGNHPIVNLYALWLVEAVLSRRPDSRRARRVQRQFETESMRSFGRDGVHVELSTHYHIQVVRLLEEYSVLSSLVGVGSELRRTGFLDFLRASTSDLLPHESNTRVPFIGDHAHSFFGADLQEDWAFLRALNPSRYGGRNAMLPKNLDAEVLRRLRPRDSESPTLSRGRTTACDHDEESLSNSVAPAALRYFADAGYLVSRDGNGGFCLFDAGPLGFHRNAGHAHADFLNILLHLKSIPVLIDPGNLMYTDDPASLWFKRQVAHNGFYVEDMEPAVLWRYFRWSSPPSRPELNWRQLNSGFTARATFRGFQRPIPIVHERSIRLDWQRGLQIFDHVWASSPFPSVSGFSLHLDPRWNVESRSVGIWTMSTQGMSLRIEFRIALGQGSTRVVSEPLASNYGVGEMGPVLRSVLVPGWRDIQHSAFIDFRR